MPSQDLFLWFQEHLTIVDRWIVNGSNYQKTAEDWLLKMDMNSVKIKQVFGECYGEDSNIWFNRWRMFYLAVAEVREIKLI